MPDQGRGRVTPIGPPQITIRGAQPIARTIYEDPRGFLIETLRADDGAVDGERFRMSYSSLTHPGQFRDADRWHVHQVQTDRFVVVLGEMMLALLDGREGSPSAGRLEVVRMVGASPSGQVAEKGSSTTFLVPIPPGVLHCVGNLSDSPFLLQNYPTELYNPTDEGRVPFRGVRVAALDGPFDWSEVARTAANR